eukprot:2583619-Amphidinium_carterae.1
MRLHNITTDEFQDFWRNVDQCPPEEHQALQLVQDAITRVPSEWVTDQLSRTKATAMLSCPPCPGRCTGGEQPHNESMQIGSCPVDC